MKSLTCELSMKINIIPSRQNITRFPRIPEFVFLAILSLAFASSALAEENLIEGLLEPESGQLPPIVRTDDLNGDIESQVTVEDGAYIFSPESEEESISFKTKLLPELSNDRKYQFTVEVDVQSLETFLNSGDGVSNGVRIYYHSTSGGTHIWAIFTGSGGTGGWVKAVLPIDLLTTPELANGYIMVNVVGARGKIKVRNFRIEPVSEDTSQAPHFVLPNGVEIEGQLYQL